jgi:hypothetical protein
MQNPVWLVHRLLILLLAANATRAPHVGNDAFEVQAACRAPLTVCPPWCFFGMVGRSKQKSRPKAAGSSSQMLASIRRLPTETSYVDQHHSASVNTEPQAYDRRATKTRDVGV